MAPIRVRPTRADVSIADAISRHTGRSTEKAAGLLTWGADEHIICALAAGWWLYSRSQSGQQRSVADHILITTLAASALPHLLKTLFDQERPDRRTILGHWRLPAMPYMSGRLLPQPASFRPDSAISPGVSARRWC